MIFAEICRFKNFCVDEGEGCVRMALQLRQFLSAERPFLVRPNEFANRMLRQKSFVELASARLPRERVRMLSAGCSFFLMPPTCVVPHKPASMIRFSMFRLMCVIEAVLLGQLLGFHGLNPVRSRVLSGRLMALNRSG